MHTHIKSGSVKGYYKLSVYKADGTEVAQKSRGPVKNVITQTGFENGIFFLSRTQDWAFTYQGLYLAVGTGTSELSSTATTLGNHLKITDRVDPQNVQRVDNNDGTETISVTNAEGFNIGEFDGDQISEIGVCRNSSGAELWAGQLIKDENGDPTTITILSDEQLFIEYTRELTVPFVQKTVKTGTLTVKGEAVDYTIYMNPFLAYDDGTADTRFDTVGYQMSIYTSTGGNLASMWESSMVTMDESDFTLSYQLNWTWAPSDFNTTDLKWIVIGDNFSELPNMDPWDRGNSQAALIVEFDTPIEKKDTEAFTLDFSFTLEFTQE